MKKNIGSTDKLIRLIIAFALLIWVWFDTGLSTTNKIIILVIALIAALTSFLEYCPLYVPFKISTRKDIPPSEE